jgi:dephospho-CoA kinase
MSGTSSGSRSRRPRQPGGPVLGLTGGIASGKSTVAALLTELGAKVICADTLAREVVAPGTPGLAAVAARFGDGYLTADGHLDRARLGRLVFADPQARHDLEAILHPLIRQAFADAVARIRGSDPNAAVVYDAPLLIEAGADREVDRVIVVAVDEAVQVRRLMERDGLTEADARARIRAQLPPEERLRHADVVIDGTAPKARIKERLAALLEELAAAP